MIIDNLLVSVYDKRGISDFIRQIQLLGYGVIASQGTLKHLEKNEVHGCKTMQDITKNPSGFEDCIQSISFRLPAGIVFERGKASHELFIQSEGIIPISVVVYNFPPPPDDTFPESNFNIQHIDVGGPCLVRCAATNFHYVLSVIDPDDYSLVLEKMIQNDISLDFRRLMAIKSLQYIQQYDESCIKYLKNDY